MAGNDYQSVTSTELIFAPGETTKIITINVTGETLIEDHETFSVVLADSINATIASGTGTGTILNEDTALRIGDFSAIEGDSAMTPFEFTVTLERASALPVTVSYETADGTAQAGRISMRQWARCSFCTRRNDEDNQPRGDGRDADRRS